jgi:hypothetical protein
VSTPPEPDGPTAGGSRGSRLPAARAGLVIVGFVVATVLLLGVIHPTSATSASGSAATSTTGSTASTTATTVASSATTTPGHASGSPSTIPPAHVSVLVANASGVSGAAAAVSAQLQPSGWNMETPVNASAHVPSSSVYYLAGQQQSALNIASTLHLPSTAVAPYTTAAPISSIGTAEVVVVVGPDLASRASSSTTTTATTTATTVARSPTTTIHH